MQTQTDKRKEATGNQEDIEKATEFDLSALKKKAGRFVNPPVNV